MASKPLIKEFVEQFYYPENPGPKDVSQILGDLCNIRDFSGMPEALHDEIVSDAIDYIVDTMGEFNRIRNQEIALRQAIDHALEDTTDV